MERCYKCGVSSEKTELNDAISKDGIIKICEKCNSFEKLPLVKKVDKNKILEETSKKPQTYQEKYDKKFYKKEPTLRDLIDKKGNFEKQEVPEDLIENFYWVIKRVRRLKKITLSQLAKEIGESEEVLKMLEEGIIPTNVYRIVNKIEDYFHINLRKKGHEKEEVDIKKRMVLDNSLIKGEEDKVVILNDEDDLEEKEKTPKKSKGFFSNIFKKKKKEDLHRENSDEQSQSL